MKVYSPAGDAGPLPELCALVRIITDVGQPIPPPVRRPMLAVISWSADKLPRSQNDAPTSLATAPGASFASNVNPGHTQARQAISSACTDLPVVWIRIASGRSEAVRGANNAQAATGEGFKPCGDNGLPWRNDRVGIER